MVWRVLCIGISLSLLLGASVDMGDAYLAEKRWPLAEQVFRDALEERPRWPRARLGLAKALKGQGRCSEVLSLLKKVRRRKLWNYGGAMMEADCALQSGTLARAAAALDEAVFFSQKHPEPLFMKAMIYHRLGDRFLRDQWIEMLGQHGSGEGLYLLGKTRAALDDGSPTFDLWFEVLRHYQMDRMSPSLTVETYVLDGQRWLDLGENQLATASFLSGQKVSLLHAKPALWRAEALRRQGHIDGVSAVLTRRTSSGNIKTPFMRAVEIRWRVDRGEIDQALSLFNGTEERDVELMASRWYVARAIEDKASVKHWARRWRANVSAQGRTLEQLIPSPARE